MNKERLTVKIQIMVEPSLILRIDDWRYKNRVSSRSKAMRRILAIILDDEKAKSSAEAATSTPSQSSTNPHEGIANEPTTI